MQYANNVRHIERAEYRVNAKRVTHRDEKKQPDFDVERPTSGKTRYLLSRKSRKIEREEGTVGGIRGGKMRGACATGSFPWLRNVSRSNARTFDPVRLSFETASCAEEAKRIADPRCFSFFFFFYCLIASN